MALWEKLGVIFQMILFGESICCHQVAKNSKKENIGRVSFSSQICDVSGLAIFHKKT
jgi:hypothetical protein